MASDTSLTSSEVLVQLTMDNLIANFLDTSTSSIHWPKIRRRVRREQRGQFFSVDVAEDVL